MFSEGLIRTCVLPLAEFIRPFYSALPEREERRTANMPKKPMARPISLSQAELCAVFDYEPDSGLLRWKAKSLLGGSSDVHAKSWNSARAGAVAGTKKLSPGKEYTQVSVKGRLYRAHRLIWVMVHGSIDETLVIDHINGDGRDNRLANLRLVEHAENQKNITMRRDNRTGVMGVQWNPEKRKWQAKITSDRVIVFLGYHDSFEDAVTARRLSEKQLGFHQYHGLSREQKTAPA